MGNKTGGETGIRTLGRFPFNGFQDRRNRPLCHLSVANIIIITHSVQVFFCFFVGFSQKYLAYLLAVVFSDLRWCLKFNMRMYLFKHILCQDYFQQHVFMLDKKT